MRTARRPEVSDMIRCLRRKHRIIFILLAVMVPILFVLGLMARRPIDVMDRVPDVLVSDPGAGHEP